MAGSRRSKQFWQNSCVLVVVEHLSVRTTICLGERETTKIQYKIYSCSQSVSVQRNKMMQVWVHAYLDFSSGRLSFTQIHTVKYLIVSDDRAWSGGLRQDQMRVWVAVIGNGSIQRAWFGLANSRPIRRIETGFLSEYALCDSKGTSIESHQNQRNQRQMHGSERDGSEIHNTQWTMGSVDMGPSGCSDQWSIVSPMQSHF